MRLFDRTKNTHSKSDDDEIWQAISDPSHIEIIIKESRRKPQLIYKHSHRCSVCVVAQGNLEGVADNLLEETDMHFINVVENRKTSDAIASQLGVRHESPQAILLDNGEVVWHASHGNINTAKILERLAN